MEAPPAADRISRIAPPQELSRWVEAFAGRSALRARMQFPVFPTARAELIFHFGDPFLVGEDPVRPLRPLPPVALLGPRREIHRQAAGPRIDWFMLQLSPLGCRRLLGLSFAEAWGREIAFTDRWAQDLHERLAEAASFSERAAIAGETLRALDRNGIDRLSEAVSLARAGRLRSVVALCRRIDVGPRRLHQLFVRETGAAPKLFLSLMRFGRQLEGLHPQPLLAVGAPELEYADESHAIREFRRFAGVTPGAYVAQKRNGDRLVYTGAAMPLES